MRWSMKVMLFFLSIQFVLSCSELPDEVGFDSVEVEQLDFLPIVFEKLLAGNWEPNPSLQVDITKLENQFEDLDVYWPDNNIEPNAFVFVNAKQVFFEKANDLLTNQNDVKFFENQSYLVWLTPLAGKYLLEWSMYKHPEYDTVLMLRRKVQE